MDALAPRNEDALKRQYEKNRAGRTEHSTLREQVVYPKPKDMWPTPTCQEVEHKDVVLTRSGRRVADNGNSHSLNLADSVKMWPTPAARDHKGANSFEHIQNAKGRAHMDQLANAVKWPTPSATPRGAHTGKECGTVSDDGKSRTSSSGVTFGATLETAVYSDSGSGQLNPDWVEWLMGWPIKWTALEPIELDWRDWSGDPADTGEVPRVTTKCKNRVSRLKAIGNGQVPAVVQIAWRYLIYIKSCGDLL